MSTGWIKIHREIIDWRWASDPNMVSLLLHLIVKANHKDGYWKDVEVKRGQAIVGLKKLSESTGIPLQRLRTCLKRLETSGEITVKSTNKYSLVTLVKYEDFQSDSEESTFKQHSTNNQSTTNKNEKNKKNNKGLDLSSFSGDKLDLVKEWISYRTEKKKKLTQKSVDLLSKKMKEHSVASCEHVINKSISNGWTGLFWDNIPKENTNEGFKLDLNNL